MEADRQKGCEAGRGRQAGMMETGRKAVRKGEREAGREEGREGGMQGGRQEWR